MLRSRSNRQQRPSESSDERSNSQSSYHYGGYPSASSAGPMSISSGADDDDEYSKKKQARPSPRFGGFGSSPRNNNNSMKSKYGVSPSAASSFARNTHHKRNNNNNNSYSGILTMLAITLLLLLSGTTLYYRKQTTRSKHELSTLKAQARHPHERHHDKDNADNIAHAEALTELKRTRSQLQGELTKRTTYNTDIDREIMKTTKVIDALKVEMKSYHVQYDQMARSWNDLDITVRELRQKFIDSHSNHHEDGTTGIVAGGPGHTLNQQRELEQMDSIEDYEDYLQRREDALWDKIDLLIEKIGRESKREALEWFGGDLLRHGVAEEDVAFRVDLEVEYPQYEEERSHDNPETWMRTRGKITIEMAPIDEMPIAVNLFLQQIHHKLWDGCNFVINAMHILQAGPHQYTGEGSYAANTYLLKSKFEKSRLDKMPYQEYSTEYPHVKYTVGFAGRPGGPDFYINKVDNSVNHGPGGQTHHDLHEEADPCFGRVVGGFEIMDAINQIPVDREKGSLLAAQVSIIGGKVIAFRKGELNRSDGGVGLPPSSDNAFEAPH